MNKKINDLWLNYQIRNRNSKGLIISDVNIATTRSFLISNTPPPLLNRYIISVWVLNIFRSSESRSLLVNVDIGTKYFLDAGCLMQVTFGRFRTLNVYAVIQLFFIY